MAECVWKCFIAVAALFSVISGAQMQNCGTGTSSSVLQFCVEGQMTSPVVHLGMKNSSLNTDAECTCDISSELPLSAVRYNPDNSTASATCGVQFTLDEFTITCYEINVFGRYINGITFRQTSDSPQFSGCWTIQANSSSRVTVTCKRPVPISTTTTTISTTKATASPQPTQRTTTTSRHLSDTTTWSPSVTLTTGTTMNHDAGTTKPEITTTVATDSTASPSTTSVVPSVTSVLTGDPHTSTRTTVTLTTTATINAYQGDGDQSTQESDNMQAIYAGVSSATGAALVIFVATVSCVIRYRRRRGTKESLIALTSLEKPVSFVDSHNYETVHSTGFDAQELENSSISTEHVNSDKKSLTSSNQDGSSQGNIYSRTLAGGCDREESEFTIEDEVSEDMPDSSYNLEHRTSHLYAVVVKKKDLKGTPSHDT